MASDRKPDAPENETRDDSSVTELNSKTTTGSSAAPPAKGKPDSGQASGSAPADVAATRQAKRRREVEVEDEFDDEFDEEEDEEDEEEIRRRERERRARAKRQATRRRGPKKKRNIPTTEEQLNVPKRQTIGMLGSVSLLMIIMWFAARLACNAHPDHIRDPRYVSVDQLARDPKNAGLEFALRFASKDILLAGEIATGAMGDKIRELIQSCEKNVDGCAHEREALKNKITGTASLLEMSPKRALVEATTYTSNENPHTTLLELVPVGQGWKVAQAREVEKKPEAAEPLGIQADAGTLPATSE
jgi:hypothetical protein